jgi:hypothetical protein
MRQRATYRITGSPTSSVKRAAKAERDMASSRVNGPPSTAAPAPGE